MRPRSSDSIRWPLRSVARRQVAGGEVSARFRAASKSRLVRIAVPLISRMISPGWKPTLPAIVRRDDLLRWIDVLPPEILRVKAIARFEDEPGAEFLVEKTDDHKWGASALRLGQPSGLAPTAVLIGVQLDHQALQARADAMRAG